MFLKNGYEAQRLVAKFLSTAVRKCPPSAPDGLKSMVALLIRYDEALSRGWKLTETAETSPANRAGIDFILSNERLKVWFLIDVTIALSTKESNGRLKMNSTVSVALEGRERMLKFESKIAILRTLLGMISAAEESCGLSGSMRCVENLAEEAYTVFAPEAITVPFPFSTEHVPPPSVESAGWQRSFEEIAGFQRRVRAQASVTESAVLFEFASDLDESIRYCARQSRFSPAASLQKCGTLTR